MSEFIEIGKDCVVRRSGLRNCEIVHKYGKPEKYLTRTTSPRRD